MMRPTPPPRRRLSLGTRIAEVKSQIDSPLVRPQAEPQRRLSFSEQYRDTEYETPVIVIPTESHIARGRVFVMLTLTATVVTSALIVGSSTL